MLWLNNAWGILRLFSQVGVTTTRSMLSVEVQQAMSLISLLLEFYWSEAALTHLAPHLTAVQKSGTMKCIPLGGMKRG